MVFILFLFIDLNSMIYLFLFKCSKGFAMCLCK